MKAELKANGTTVMTGEVRLSYCHLLQPWCSDADKAAGKEPKYGVCVIIPKTDVETLKVVKAAIDNAVNAGLTKHGAGWKAAKKPLRDGDAKEEGGDDFLYADDDARRGSYFFNAGSKTAPAIMDAKMQPITSEEVIYSGAYARVLVNFYPFKGQQNGIAAGLNGVQKVRDGERLGGTVANAFEEFTPLESTGDVAAYDPLA